MRNTTHDDLRKDEIFRSLCADKAYLFARSNLRKMGIWSMDEYKEIAYDITLEAVVELYEKAGKGELITNKDKFMHDFVRNYLRRNEFKNFVARRMSSLSPEKESLVEVQASFLPDSDGFTLDGHQILNSLNELEKEVVKRKNRGYSNSEIADMLNMSTSNVHRIIGKIRIKINRRLYLS